MQRRPTIIFGANYGPDVDPSRWVVIYPPYIDKTRKECEGRKIAKDKCVDNPNMKEVFDCAQLLKFQTALELDKAYPRDYWARGRIRIKLFDENKTPIREDIPNRRTLYAKVAQLIPQHREQMAKRTGQAKGKGGGGGKAGQSAKQATGKGAPAPKKTRKKGKR